MTKLENRLIRLVKLLKNNDDYITYRKAISRLKFVIMRILYVENKDNLPDIYFCMIMANGEALYLETRDITTDELKSIVKDLENILVNG